MANAALLASSSARPAAALHDLIRSCVNERLFFATPFFALLSAGLSPTPSSIRTKQAPSSGCRRRGSRMPTTGREVFGGLRIILAFVIVGSLRGGGGSFGGDSSTYAPGLGIDFDHPDFISTPVRERVGGVSGSCSWCFCCASSYVFSNSGLNGFCSNSKFSNCF